MKHNYHIAVIGAGSAGLVVASGAASFGAKVALIEKNKMGGDCLNTGCVPSKSFLKCAHLAKDIRSSAEFGLEASVDEVDLEKVMERVRSVIRAIEPHDSKERYESMGVDVFTGNGQLLDRHSVRVNDKIITAKSIVLATGSEPVIPNIKGLDNVPYLTNKNIFELKKLPAHLIVLGGGPIGLELGQGFRHLGSKVTIIDKSNHIFVKDDPEAAAVMEKAFQNDGIGLMLNSTILEVKKDGDAIIVVIESKGQKLEITGDSLLVSLGRKPVSYGFGLDKAGVLTDSRGFIITNKKMQTNIRNIFACGDAAGPYQFTHMASYQAGIALKNIIFKLGSKADYSTVPWTTYTKPEVAHIGYTEPLAKSLNLFKESVVINLAENDRAKAENDITGFLKLNVGKRGKVIGATLIGDKAGEMIPLVTMAIKQKLKVTAFLNIIFSYPTESEIFLFASLKKVKASFRCWQKKLIKLFFLK